MPALAPLVPHLAEDAWHSAPWQVPTASVFQSGWYSAPEQWQSMPDAEQKALRALKLIRSAFHNALGADMQANFENAWVELVL